jgi:hypothetical protein
MLSPSSCLSAIIVLNIWVAQAENGYYENLINCRKGTKGVCKPLHAFRVSVDLW